MEKNDLFLNRQQMQILYFPCLAPKKQKQLLIVKKKKKKSCLTSALVSEDSTERTSISSRDPVVTVTGSHTLEMIFQLLLLQWLNVTLV